MKKKCCQILLFFVFFNNVLYSEILKESYKQEVLFEMAHLNGWCSDEKAILIMDLIAEKQFQCCVEIGVFAGKSLLPIAKALQYNSSGKVYAIDAWDVEEAVKGFSLSDPAYVWWGQLDFNLLNTLTVDLIEKNNLQNYCQIIKESSRDAVHLFEDEMIDFIHFDGNHNEEIVLQDVVEYFSKVKNGGYILLNDPNWLSMRAALIFLLERTDIVSEFSRFSTFLLLRKSQERIQKAKELLNNENLQIGND